MSSIDDWAIFLGNRFTREEFQREYLGSWDESPHWLIAARNYPSFTKYIRDHNIDHHDATHLTSTEQLHDWKNATVAFAEDEKIELWYSEPFWQVLKSYVNRGTLTMAPNLLELRNYFVQRRVESDIISYRYRGLLP